MATLVHIRRMFLIVHQGRRRTRRFRRGGNESHAIQQGVVIRRAHSKCLA
jgi:hypothetical protein